MSKDNSVRHWPTVQDQPSLSSTDASDFEKVGGLSVIERDEEENQRTLANDITLDGPSNVHSTWFRNSPQDTLRDLFDDTTSFSRIDWEGSTGLPSLEEAAEALRNMPLDGDLVGAIAGLSAAIENKSPERVQQIHCSHRSLSWFNVGVGGESCQTISFKNNSNSATIMLTLKIDGKDNTFKLASDNRLSDEMRIELKPERSVELLVIFRPLVKGQISSQMDVSYSNRRFHVYLYGYGGKSSVCLRGVDFNSAYNSLMVPVPIKTLTASFVVYNSGEETGVFSVQNAISEQCSLSPTNGIVSPRDETVISVRCKIDASSLRLDGNSHVILHKFAITFEDNSTDLRIQRMKYSEEDPRLNHPRFQSVNRLNDDPKKAVVPQRKTVFILVCMKAEEVKRCQRRAR